MRPIKLYGNINYFQFLTRNWFSIETDTEAMYSSFLWLKINPELCVALALHVIRDILAVHCYYNLQISSPGLTGVDWNEVVTYFT